MDEKMSERNTTELHFLVDRALKYSEKDKEDILSSFGMPRIAFVGVGGAGNNSMNRLERLGGVDGVDRIAVNTDKFHLDSISCEKKVLIGKSLTQGLGAGGSPEVARRAAEIDRNELEGLLVSGQFNYGT